MKHEIAQYLLDELNEKVENQMLLYEHNSDEYSTLKSIQRELVFRREASLRSSIRKLMLGGLAS